MIIILLEQCLALEVWWQKWIPYRTRARSNESFIIRTGRTQDVSTVNILKYGCSLVKQNNKAYEWLSFGEIIQKRLKKEDLNTQNIPTSLEMLIKGRIVTLSES